MVQALQLKISLRGSKPPIWRRLQLPADFTLTDLHYLIQLSFGWENCHLHQFEIGDRRFSQRSPFLDDPNELEDLDADRYLVGKVLTREKQKGYYTYDFGDDWMHEILVEKLLDEPLAENLPVCVTGRRAGPPEDCGGIWGYQDLLWMRANPDDPRAKEFLAWNDEAMEETPDPAHFDVQAVNEEFRKFFAPAPPKAKRRSSSRRSHAQGQGSS